MIFVILLWNGYQNSSSYIFKQFIVPFFPDQLCRDMDDYPNFKQYWYFIPNPEDCTSFYRCNKHTNRFGIIVFRTSLHKCSDNYGWDVNSKVCRRIDSMPCCFRGTVLQYGLWSFQTGGVKLERFLPKNQHTQRKLSIDFWELG